MSERLWNKNFILIFLSNLAMAFAFNLLLPTIPIYLTEQLGIQASKVGIVMSSYTLGILLIRPFSGFLVDTLPRKRLYLIALVFFGMVFCGYLFAATVLLMVLVRFLHGLGWGISSVAGNTIAIDSIPSHRRGEGVGYFGLTLNIAMAVAPIFGTMLYEKGGFPALIYGCLAASAVGMGFASQLKLNHRPPVAREPLSLDRFILVKGLPAGGSFIFCAIPYGMLVSYVILYGREIAISNPPLFFLFLALGIGTSRLISGRLVDKGYMHQLTAGAMIALILSLLLLSTVHDDVAFNASGYFIGVSYGTMVPGFQYLFVNLAPASKRGTANSTYLISFDIGVSLGMLLGGFMASSHSLPDAYLLGAASVAVSLAFYLLKVRSHFDKNKNEVRE